MIKISDFSESTLEQFGKTIFGDITIFDFVLMLLKSDFEPKEIKQFINEHFGKGYTEIVNKALKSL